MLVGGGEPERSFAESLIGLNKLHPGKTDLIRGFSREFIRNPGISFSCKRIFSILLEFGMRYFEHTLVNLKKLNFPSEKVFPYNYIGWNEDTILTTITNILQWDSGNLCGTSWRSDCYIASLKNYIYSKMLGFNKVDELLSGMVRIGQITRIEALQRVSAESWINREELDSFLKKHSISISEIDRAITGWNEKNIK